MELLALFSIRHLRVRNFRMFAFDRLPHRRAGHGSVDVGHSAGFEVGGELGHIGQQAAALPAALCIKASLVIHFNTQTLSALITLSDFLTSHRQECRCLLIDYHFHPPASNESY